MVVAAGIFSKDGKILIGRRSKGKPYEGFWEFPGGKVEAGETPESSVEREFREELNITVKAGPFIGENTYHYDFGPVRILLYRVFYVSGALNPKDHDQLDWAEPKRLASFNLLPGNVALLPQIEKKLAVKSK